MQKIIAYDVDGVIADLLPKWVKWYNADFNDTLDWRKINQWDLIPFIKPEGVKKIYKYIADPSIYDEVKEIPGALGGVNETRNMGYRTIFVTSTPVGCSGRKYKWLNDMGFEVKLKDYFEAEDKSLIASDYLVDDRDLNVENAFGQGVIFTAEYNKKLIGYPRVDTWDDIINYFGKQENK